MALEDILEFLSKQGSNMYVTFLFCILHNQYCFELGAGKSCLLNSLGGEPLFKSGVNLGKGLTYNLDEKVNKNGHFLDTPGIQPKSK